MADVEALPEVIVTEAVEDTAGAGEPVEDDNKAEEEGEKEMTLEERKEEEQAVIQRQIEQTQAEMERLEAMEGSLGEAGAQGFNLQQLEVRLAMMWGRNSVVWMRWNQNHTWYGIYCLYILILRIISLDFFLNVSDITYVNVNVLEIELSINSLYPNLENLFID